MSLLSTQSLFQYAIASLGQAFSPACPIQNTSDFLVTYTSTGSVDTVLSLNTDYFVTGAATSGVITSPTVTLEATGLHYVVGGTLTIQRKPPATQATTYVDGVSYLAATPNNSLDWLCYSIQALYDIVNRCPQLPGTAAAQTPFTTLARAGKVLGYDNNGNFAVYSVTTGGVQPFPLTIAPAFPFYFPAVTALTGGATTNLDGVPTVNAPVPALAILTIGGSSSLWKLQTSSATPGAGVVRPTDNSALRWIQTG